MTDSPVGRSSIGGWIARHRSGLPLFVGLLVVAALPFLAFQYVPVEDGPAHVGNGAILLDPGSPVFSEYFDLDLSRGTNLLADLVLAGLLTVLSAGLADKAMALMLLLALPLSVRRCLRQLQPGAAWLAVLAIPVGGGLLLYFGFYNFLLGVVLSFLAFGYWLKHLRSERVRPATTAAFAGLVVLVFLAHPLPFLALMLMLGAAVLDEALASGARGTPARHRAGRLCVPIALAALIPVVFLVGFGARRSAPPGYARPFSTRILSFPLDATLSLTNGEIPFVLLYMLAFGILALAATWCCRDQLSKAPGFPVAVLLLSLLYFFGPDSVGKGSLILPREQLYLLVLLLFGLAKLSLPRWASTSAVVFGSVATVGLAVVRFPVHAEFDASIREYVSGTRVVKAGSTVLPLWGVESERGVGAGGRRVSPLAERGGYLIAATGSVDLHHFPGYEDIFPINFAPGYGVKELAPVPDRYRDFFVLGPAVLDLSQYESSGRGRIDYVWLWDRAAADSAQLAEPHTRRLLEQLEEDYERVHESPHGRLEVFARKGRG